MKKQRIKLRLNWKKFNPNFYHLAHEFRNTARRFIWIYGGSSSAKSYSAAQALLVIGCLLEGSSALVFRKVSATIDDSIYKDFTDNIERLGLGHLFVCIKHKITCTATGAVIVFKGLDSSEKIKGIAGFKRVLLDEISEFDHSDFKQIRKRLRGQLGQQIIAAFNPIDEEHWIKTEIFDKQKPHKMPLSLAGFNELVDRELAPEFTAVTEKWEGAPVILHGTQRPSNFVVIRSTHKNNFWVVGSPCGTFGFEDVQALLDFEHDRVHDYDYYCVYALGLWGKLNRGGEMYKNFKIPLHVKPASELKYNPELPLHIAFDENVHPYMTLDIFQAEDLRAWQIDEICLEDPLNTLKHTIKEFINRYPNNGLTVFIYGDSTSRKQDVKLEKGVDFYVLIENQLRAAGYTTARRVPSKNPNVDLRCNWFNEVLIGYDDIEVFFSNKCEKTIQDYKYLKQAADGSKHKEKAKNTTTGVTYEKYGHNTDANDYFFTTYFNVSFSSFGRAKTTSKATITKHVRKKSY